MVVLFRFFSLFSVVAAAAQHVSPNGDWALVERVGVPAGWLRGPMADPKTMFDMKINLRDASKVEHLHQKVMELSTPGHASYGQHLKREAIDTLMKPNVTVTESILQWLKDGGVQLENVKSRADWIRVSLPVGVASKLLNARFYEFTDRYTKVKKIRTTEYWVPKTPSVTFRRLAQRAIPPNCLRELYGLGNVTAKPGSRNKITVSGYLDQYAQYRDLSLFLRKYAPQAAGANFSVSLVNGGQNTQNSTHDSREANLDIQYVIALSYNMKVEYLSVKGRGPLKEDLDQPNQASNQNEPYMNQLEYLHSLPDEDLPTVLTTSYGESEQSVPEPYARATCNEFAKLAARGVSIIFSSGDSGVGSSCMTNDGQNRTTFNPIFPATCPWVTSIGSTHSRNPEAAIGFSSGGFSNYFARPEWQQSAVTEYLRILDTRWQGYYNPHGRGFPDIAAQGIRYPIYDKGVVKMAAGTSASAPTIAAIIAHLNEIRLSQGKPVLGFLNPWLYSKGFRGFTDITNGGSIGCTGTALYSGLPARYVPYASWNATKGWDPVTGFGTPNFEKLVKLMP
ncbi:hypothetical protein UREG_00260 [Uncinocarpus reesii 1704]|uniref:tripeptidyl-peptidase II n=1 Tax=Uncinocarpus reesii (strain UAMH 1704) TaxID=336963 RepID=C4JL45_UNCRE|nr:uncharacterized protein UREG_00260 [Uncinocarpus reesii 1704]EEP75414.1 hypothetical protein UREG_00260 [Uncinocarpus reesii 1704]